MLFRLSVVALPALTLSVPALVAHAQETDPRAILAASTEALSAVQGMGAQFRMFGEGSDMIKSTMPSMQGRFIFARTEQGPLIHVLGEAKDSATAESYAYDIVRTPDQFRWTDDAAKTINIRKAQPEPRDLPGAARMIQLANLIREQPFAELLERAESLSHEGVKDVAGVPCDVIAVALKKNPPGRNANAAPHTNERWFIGVQDRLPRRVEMITDGGMLKFSLITEMSGLGQSPQAPALLDIRRPENYTVNDTTVAAEKPAPRPQPQVDTIDREPAPAQPAPAPVPTTTQSPIFTLADADGKTIDNNTQMGRVTVLYFWGTWCIPCRAVSPKISDLAARFEGQPVDVLGLAIRERDPAAVKSYVAEQAYKHRLVLNGASAATDFKIRIYPTVVVIGPGGEIVYEGSPSKDRDAEKLATEVADAVQKALPANGE